MSTKIIKINRGDSLEFPISAPKLVDNEILYFAIMYPNQRFEDAILVNGYTKEDQGSDDEIIVKLEPNDTRKLAVGVYYYTMKLQKGGTLEDIADFDNASEIKTLVERTKFIINE